MERAAAKAVAILAVVGGAMEMTGQAMEETGAAAEGEAVTMAVAVGSVADQMERQVERREAARALRAAEQRQRRRQM